jgi:hypothetical protein
MLEMIAGMAIRNRHIKQTEGVWNGVKFLWSEMHRTSHKPSLARFDHEIPFFNFKGWWKRLLRKKDNESNTRI